MQINIPLIIFVTINTWRKKNMSILLAIYSKCFLIFQLNFFSKKNEIQFKAFFKYVDIFQITPNQAVFFYSFGII